MSTRKLLLADDSITIQKVVNLTFADEGIEVVSVSDGDSAMEKLTEFAPDLVMADVNMPGLNGYEICEKIKQGDSFQKVPVILLVGSFEPFDEEKARRVGADDFLTKPFQSIRQLVTKVTLLLDAKNGEGENAADSENVSSLADTAELEAVAETPFQSEELGDAGMDDEMIETNQINSFALDESAKFETKEEADELGKTQPLSVYDLKEFSFVADQEDAQKDSADDSSENEAEKFDAENTEFQPVSAETDISEEENPTAFAPQTFQSDENSFETETADGNSEIEAENEENQRGESSDFYHEAETGELEQKNAFESDSAAEHPADSQGFAIVETAYSVTQSSRQSPFSVGDDDDLDDLLEIPFDEEEEAEEIHSTEKSESAQSAQKESEESPSTEDNFQDYSQEPESAFGNSEENDAYVQNQEKTENFSENTESKNFESQSESESSTYIGNLTDSADSAATSAAFSPEMIDAIAQRVIEKLSDSVVREIAWEVVPQQADLIIRKMVEEKLKEE